MGLEARLRQLESRVIPASREPGHIDIDQYLARLGLVPTAVRELASSKRYGIVEAMCEMVGIEPRDFISELKEKVRRVR